MNNNIFIILGNGFSIELIEKLELSKQIDLSNLFSKGDQVVWPGTQEKGFLSYKRCQNLWTLGARSHIDKDESGLIIDNVITALNVYNFVRTNDSRNPDEELSNIYVQAYNELSTYLKHLFIHYNSLVSDSQLSAIGMPLIDYIKKRVLEGYCINIITYNYDIFLERLLYIAHIDYKVEGFHTKESNVNIIKPHGSINYSSKKRVKAKQFEIKSIFNSIECKLDELELLTSDLNIDDSLINAIIPPSGDSNRLSSGWPYELRNIIENKLNHVTEKDVAIFYGISYCHVDRMEIDRIITSLHPKTNVKYVNPYPSETFDIVLCSIFENYIHLQNSNSLMEV